MENKEFKKFNGDWTEDRIKDLIISHKGRNHTETAINLSHKWGVVVTRDIVKNKFNRLIELKKQQPDAEPTKSREYYDKIASDRGCKGKRTYFVTSAIAGCSLAKNFFDSVKTFCDDKKARLVVLPCRGALSKDEEYNQDVLDELEKYFFTEYTFNSNICAFDIGLSPTTVNPLAGLYRIAEETSVIIASPKQSMEVIPVGNVSIPHLLHSTGSITTGIYGQNKVGLLAGNDHVIGGIILEVEDDRIFHIRQVRSAEDGSFCDLDKKYSANKVQPNNASAVVLGDIHNGFQHPKAMKAWDELIKLVNPKYIALHDLFDSHSISHHLENNITQKSNRQEPFSTLRMEIDSLWKFISDFSSEYKKSNILIVASNHNEHLDKYIDNGRFFMDYPNYRTALELAMYRLDGLNILKAFIEKNYGKLKNIFWLKRDEDFKVHGCQLSAHGDYSFNGGKGSINGLEKVYHNAIVGHSHSPRIQSDLFQVGTSTRFDLPYLTGGSTWLHASAVLHNDGNKQMIIAIDGSWRI